MSLAGDRPEGRSEPLGMQGLERLAFACAEVLCVSFLALSLGPSASRRNSDGGLGCLG